MTTVPAVPEMPEIPEIPEIPEMPAGPWVLVVGAHRSGTSATTGALVSMGVQGVDPGDRMVWSNSNPEHWESLAAAVFDDDLLGDLGGTWDAPPELGRMPDPAAAGRSPADIMATAYPAPGPVVWKDPRACLLLPYWRQILPGPLTAVFVWRDPLAVARSLHARDGMSMEYGLALWERYNRSALAGLQGIDTYVLDYDAVVADPTAAFSAVAVWLTDLGRFDQSGRRWDVDAAAATIERDLRHQSGQTDEMNPYPADATVLSQWLGTVAGGHRPFNVEPPAPVSGWPEALIAQRRDQLATSPEFARMWALAQGAEAMEQGLRTGYEAEIDRLVQQFQELKQRADRLAWEVHRVESSVSWKVTRPLRSAAERVNRLRG